MAAESFLEGAVIDTIIPQASDANLEEALSDAKQTGTGDDASLLPTVTQRSLLFFDELVPVYVVLRLTNCSEDVLKTQLSRLDILVEAYALSGVDDGNGSDAKQRVKHMIYSGAVNEKEDPLVVVDEVDEDNNISNYVYVIWKTDAFLSRPRMRLQQPVVVFTAVATIGTTKPQVEDDVYLPSRMPASSNVFQPLAEDANHREHRNLFLPTSRLLRVIPMASPEGSAWRVQQHRFKPFAVFPVANARVRYSRVNTISTRPITIASLDFEVMPLTTNDVVLDKADLTVPDGHVECLTKASGFAPPVTCRPRDNVTLIYRLTPREDIDISSATTASMFTLDISIKATVLLSDNCHSKITMQWRTNVDFSVPLNPHFGAPTKFMQRPRRPSNLSVTTTSGGGSISNSNPENRRSTHSVDSGITISFSGPRYVRVGEEFHWDVFIVNKSTKPRRFILAAMPKRKKTDTRKNVARPSSSSSAGLRGEPIAEAVTDDNFVYAMQKNGVPYDTDLVCLNMDIRAGPLPPGTCHLTKIKMLPLIAGPLQVEAVKVVDLMNNDSTIIKDLPDIIALAPTEN